MDVNGKRFGEEVGEVISSFAPRDNELFLCNAISYPMKAHVNAFSLLGFDGVVGNTYGALVIT